MAPRVKRAADRRLAEAVKAARRGALLIGALRMQKEGSEGRDLTRPLLDAVALFESLGIGYALVGGMAAMVYGRARFTFDVDFVAQADHEAVLRAHPQAMREHHFNPACTWKLYHDSGAEVDLWKDPFADDMIARAQMPKLAGRTVRVVEPHDLIAMKLRADRPQDDYDISEILRGTAINDATVADRTTAEQFQRYQQIKRRIGM